MDAVIIRIVSMPYEIDGITVNDENGDYNIYLNADIPDDKRVEAFRHEIEHIKQGHFYLMDQVVSLENQAASF